MSGTTPGGDRRALVTLLSVVFLNIAGFGVVVPLLPFFGRAFHADAWQITLLFSMFSLGQFMGEQVWGRLSDRLGRRPVLIITIGISALTYVLLAFSPNIWVAPPRGWPAASSPATSRPCRAAWPTSPGPRTAPGAWG